MHFHWQKKPARVEHEKRHRAEWPFGALLPRPSGCWASSRGQTLRCTVPSDQVTVWADRQRVVQVITSLVANASRYSTDSLPVDLEVWAEGNRLRVRVSDQGRGLSSEQVKKVFEPFDPDQPSRQSESDQTEAGSGLGLVLARELVELHGGELTLHSKPGEGTVAEFGMPVVLGGEDLKTEAA